MKQKLMGKSILTGLTLLSLSNPLIAEPYWLNIPGAYSKLDGQYLPPASYLKKSHEACNEAVLRYTQNNLVHYIGCDTRPLPNAINLTAGPHSKRP